MASHSKSSEAASSSGYATLHEETDRQIALTIADLPDNESESDGSDGSASEVSEDTEAEEASKSADEQEKKDKPDEPDQDKDGATGASSVTEASSKLKYSTLDDEEFMEKFNQMIADDDTVKMKEWQEELLKGNQQLVEQFKHIKKEVSKRERAEKKKAREAEKVAKKEEEKSKGPVNLTLNLKLPTGATIPMEASTLETIGGIRKVAGKVMGLTKKKAGLLRVLYQGVDYGDNPRKTAGGLKMRDGDTITIGIVGAGGTREKRVRETDDFALLLTPSAQSDDIPDVAKALAIKTIDVEKWVETLNVEQLEEMMAYAEDPKKSGQILSLTAPYMNHIDEFKKLKDRHAGLEHNTVVM